MEDKQWRFWMIIGDQLSLFPKEHLNNSKDVNFPCIISIMLSQSFLSSSALHEQFIAKDISSSDLIRRTKTNRIGCCLQFRLWYSVILSSSASIIGLNIFLDLFLPYDLMALWLLANMTPWSIPLPFLREQRTVINISWYERDIMLELKSASWRKIRHRPLDVVIVDHSRVAFRSY